MFSCIILWCATTIVSLADGQCTLLSQTLDTYAICQIFSSITSVPAWFDITTSDICQSWNSTFVNCNGENITGIDLSNTSFSLVGALNTSDGENKWPNSLQFLRLDNNNFSGSFDFESFSNSPDISEIAITNNQFSGELNWDSLNQTSLTYLWLHNNNFSGTIDVASLSESLEGISVSSNQFSGLITDGFVAKINLSELYLQENQIDHENINFSHFSNTIRYLDISYNNISGTIDNLPDDLYQFYARYCNLDSMIWNSDIFGEHLEIFSIQNNNITSQVNFSQLPNKLEYFFGQNNNFYGNVNLSYLPSTIKTFNMSGNSLLEGPLNFNYLSNSDVEIIFDITVHCDATIYCNINTSNHVSNSVITQDRLSNTCYDRQSCNNTCSACVYNNTNVSSPTATVTTTTGSNGAVSTSILTTTESLKKNKTQMPTAISIPSGQPTDSPSQSKDNDSSSSSNFFGFGDDMMIIIYIVCGVIIIIICIIFGLKRKKKQHYNTSRNIQMQMQQGAGIGINHINVNNKSVSHVGSSSPYSTTTSEFPNIKPTNINNNLNMLAMEVNANANANETGNGKRRSETDSHIVESIRAARRSTIILVNSDDHRSGDAILEDQQIGGNTRVGATGGGGHGYDDGSDSGSIVDIKYTMEKIYQKNDNHRQSILKPTGINLVGDNDDDDEDEDEDEDENDNDNNESDGSEDMYDNKQLSTMESDLNSDSHNNTPSNRRTKTSTKSKSSPQYAD